MHTGDSGNGLVKDWNGQQLQQQVKAGAEIMSTFGQQASKAIGDYASQKALELRGQGNEAEAAKWDEGGVYRVAAHAAMGALGGGVQGALGAGAAASAAPRLNELTKDLPDGVREAVGAGLAAGLGAVTGGASGAATAFNEDTNNRQLHPDEVKWIKDNAGKFADQQGISKEEAVRRLTVEAAAQVDGFVSARVGSSVDEGALSFLNTNTNQYTWGQAFRATDAEYNNFGLYGKELASDPESFRTVYNSLYQSGVSKDTLQAAYQQELLAYAQNEVGASGRDVLKLQAASAAAGVLAAGGTSLYGVLPEFMQVGVKGAGSASGLSIASTAYKAYKERDEKGGFARAFDDDFSWQKLALTAFFSATTSMYTQQMLMWADVPTGFFQSLKTPGGLIIRANVEVQSEVAHKAGDAMIDHYSGKDKVGKND